MATGTPAMIVVPIERVNGVSTAPPPSAVIPVSAWRGYYGRPVGRVPYYYGTVLRHARSRFTA